jgi:starch synthase
MSGISALSVASEVFPLVKTGGLADVTGALPRALKRQGVAVKTLVPGYPGVIGQLKKPEIVHRWKDLFDGPARLLSARVQGLDLLVLDAPHLYERPGNPYVDANGANWPDNAQRFAGLSLAAADVARLGLGNWRADIVHAHDWQAALTPAYLRFGPKPKGKPTPSTVVTIHNLAFQGQYPAAMLEALRLPSEAFTMEGVEYYGHIGFLKAGIALADHITTVSPTYAREIQGDEMGMGLDGLLRHRSHALSGILNGIDTDAWNPASDPLLAAQYDCDRLDARRANRLALCQRFGLSDQPGAPLAAVVSRLAWQKGMDLLMAALPALIEAGGQLVVLGAGDAALEAEISAAANRFPGRVGVVLGYDEGLAHLAQGGADMILVPSRFEPCGLTQLCALRYGAIPVVARVGGLADTIIDANDAALQAGAATGFQFAPVTSEGLSHAIMRAIDCQRDAAAWRRLQKRGMECEVGWDRAAAKYANLYRSLLEKRGRD